MSPPQTLVQDDPFSKKVAKPKQSTRRVAGSGIGLAWSHWNLLANAQPKVCRVICRGKQKRENRAKEETKKISAQLRGSTAYLRFAKNKQEWISVTRNVSLCPKAH
jgi:hypothetical protein